MKQNTWFWIIAIFIGVMVFREFRSTASPKIVAPNDPWFQSEVVNQSTPVLVKFGAQWCGPCRAMEPTLEELTKTMRGKIAVVDIDVDEHPKLAEHYRVLSIPRLFLFDHGEIIGNRVGALDLKELESWIGSTIQK
ncbi:MAG: thioredoxin family protein [Pirellulaceae bacterium]|nr:thioredoxin family protein [Pirellulaceae bacterium]